MDQLLDITLSLIRLHSRWCKAMLAWGRLDEDTVAVDVEAARRCTRDEKSWLGDKCPAEDAEEFLSVALFSILAFLKRLEAAICRLRFSSKAAKQRSENLESLPVDVRENVSLLELVRSKALSKYLPRRVSFLRLRGDEGEFTALNFFVQDGAWQCTGLDLQSKTWRRMPTFACLPPPTASLFMEYSVCGDGGLMCVNVSKAPSHKETLIVFNVLTGTSRQLPPLRYARNPVVIHLVVDSATSSYKVVAAGSSASVGEENLSRRVEVLDSRTWQWEVAEDIPGPEFALNEHQAGVCVNGVLYFVAFLEGGQKGVVAFDVQKREWVTGMTCAVPYSVESTILQLVESNGEVYLFSEQERGVVVEHCIDLVKFSGEVALKRVVRVTRSGGRGLLVYPEYVCVPYGEGKLCVFNTIKRHGVVYDLHSGVECETLEPPPEGQRGEDFFCLNPVSFTLRPNFTSTP